MVIYLLQKQIVTWGKRLLSKSIKKLRTLNKMKKILIILVLFLLGFSGNTYAEGTNLSCECDFIKDVDLKKVMYENAEPEKFRNCKGLLSVVLDTDKGTISGLGVYKITEVTDRHYISEVDTSEDSFIIVGVDRITGSYTFEMHRDLIIIDSDNKIGRVINATHYKCKKTDKLF